VALDMPEPARSELATWRYGALRGRDDLRPSPIESLHATLAFLGYLPEKEIPRLGDLALGAVAELAPPRLGARGVVPVPPRGAPRLFALDLDDPEGAAGAVQGAVSDALEAAGLYTPEKRPFWPHVTLARVKRGRRAAPLDVDLPPGEPFEATDVTLYRSILRPQGALYESLDRFRLGQGLRVRPARPEDAEAMARVNVRSWQAAYRGLVADEVLDSLSIEDATRREEERSALEGSEAWVGLRDGAVVGYVSFGPWRQTPRGGPDAGEVYALYVEPGEQRRGVGRLLLERAVAALRASGYRKAVLCVLEGNRAARSFYEPLGWSLEGGPNDLEVRGMTFAVVSYGLELGQAEPSASPTSA
jgi:RNA 2',3'-cyclic 3'-phosphodiesterase